MQLEATRERLERERESRIALEEENKEQAVKTTRAIIDTQKDAMDAREEVRRCRLQADNAQSELSVCHFFSPCMTDCVFSEKVGALVQQLQMEKGDIERALVRARSTARSFKEHAVLLQAQEEGRREGFEEGLRQGRAMHGIIDLSHIPSRLPPNGAPQSTELNQKSDLTRPVVGASASNQSVSEGLKHRSYSLEAEIELQNLLQIEVKENYRVKTQLKQLESDLDKERQKNKKSELERKRLLEETDRLKRKIREKDEEMKKIRQSEETERRKLTRELNDKEEALKKERDSREDLRKRLNVVEEENENAVLRLKAEIKTLEREKQAEKRVREEMERDKEKENNDLLASGENQSIKYIPMPRPPIPINTAGPVPRTGSSASGSQHRGERRNSVGSTSSAVSLEGSPGTSGKRLRKISEVNDTDSSASPPSHPIPWTANPPGAGYHNGPTHWPHRVVPPTNDTLYPPEMPQGSRNPDRLYPGISIYGPPSMRLSNESQSSILIEIEPPVSIAICLITLLFSHCIVVWTAVEHRPAGN